MKLSSTYSGLGTFTLPKATGCLKYFLSDNHSGCCYWANSFLSDKGKELGRKNIDEWHREYFIVSYAPIGPLVYKVSQDSLPLVSHVFQEFTPQLLPWQ